jgi:hypothetical protein
VWIHTRERPQASGGAPARLNHLVTAPAELDLPDPDAVVRADSVSRARRVCNNQRLQLRGVEFALSLEIFQLDAYMEDFMLAGRIDGQIESRPLLRAGALHFERDQ